MEKSYVTLEQHICIACGHPYDTGSLLIDRRLKNTFEHHTITAVDGTCPSCTEKIKEGYIILVEIDPSKSDIVNSHIKPQDAYRTGNIVYMKKVAAEQLLSVPPMNVNFIDAQVTQHLQSLMPKEA